jgi:hypothetical protein
MLAVLRKQWVVGLILCQPQPWQKSMAGGCAHPTLVACFNGGWPAL